jgi:Pyridoxamine 5'-phosphate oxidase
MADAEIEDFITRRPTAILTTLDSEGWPHSTAMWFVPVFDGTRREVLMWSYAKSQKSVNAKRDPRSAFLVEEGVTYFELRGVLVRGALDIIEGYEAIADIGRRLHERYVTSRSGEDPSPSSLAEIERQAHKRIGLRLSVDRIASWDHSKLGSG